MVIDMPSRQFFTNCRKCGRQILMTQCLRTGAWIACDPQIFRFNPGFGYDTYVTPEGDIIRGDRDRNGLFGYHKHDLRGCRNA